MTWKREGVTSGPGNVWNGRYEVCRRGERQPNWGVFDRREGYWRWPVFATMREARAWVEQHPI